MEHDRIRTVIKTDFVAGELKARGKIRNLCAGGLFVRTSAIPEQGDSVRLRFRAPTGARVDVAGLVWWTTVERGLNDRQAGFGVRVLDASDDYQALIELLLR
jgi:Tfp pilus assembly protein PilZ